eukprot:TRINITY_DN6539_c0_g1_i4.p1 TRINITY_DN6539_c0_g1~~TRINITY_DN6539_c0_g1_i4.p1  ORF type:complete len:854 (-),score=130.85 TRINITY_DN6539_c0_g1_i4:147-2573(-)
MNHHDAQQYAMTFSPPGGGHPAEMEKPIGTPSNGAYGAPANAPASSASSALSSGRYPGDASQLSSTVSGSMASRPTHLTTFVDGVTQKALGASAPSCSSSPSAVASTPPAARSARRAMTAPPESSSAPVASSVGPGQVSKHSPTSAPQTWSAAHCTPAGIPGHGASPMASSNRSRMARHPSMSRLEVPAELENIFKMIDTNGNGEVSRLEFFVALQRESSVLNFVLPEGRDKDIFGDEDLYDLADDIFDNIAPGKSHIKPDDFFRYFLLHSTSHASNEAEMRFVYDLIDMDHTGVVSKLKLLAALQSIPDVGRYVLPGIDCSRLLEDEHTFDAANCIFEAIARGAKRFHYSEFKAHYRREERNQIEEKIDRTQIRVFIIGPGFGGKINPRQGAMIADAGFQVYWCHNIPNPEQPNFPVQPYLLQIKKEIDVFRADVVIGASKGGVYLVRLWQTRLWTGPSVLINAHPSCQQLPRDVPIVVAHGDSDEVYHRSRNELEQLRSSANAKDVLLYYVGGSGQLANGQRSRQGDSHNMMSLQHYDCLPRLIDAAMCSDGPEVQLMRSWRHRLSESRLKAEQWLGYSPDCIRKHWCSPQRKGLDYNTLFDVMPNGEEWNHVATAFKAQPKEQPAYLIRPPHEFAAVQIVRLQRVENGQQEAKGAKPYFDSVRDELEAQGVDFEPGVHTRWGFHGGSPEALDSIINDPLAGFQPLAAGTRGATLWGSGTYFARDAKYVAEGGFCGPPAADGTRQMLMCLLMVGIPCLGGPEQHGVLPYREKPHRYHSSVDSLSSPEVFVMPYSGAAEAAYLITFK